MTKQQAIKRLNKNFQHYNLNVETSSSGNNQQQLVKAFIQVFTPTEEAGKAIVTKNATGYGIGADLASAQDNAIIQAVQNLGL